MRLDNAMYQYDFYKTKTLCPRCAGELNISQGRDGPNALLNWTEGEKSPQPLPGQNDLDLEKYSLPSSFDLGSPICKSCGYHCNFLHGILENGIWSRTTFICDAVSATQEVNGFRMCSDCFEAWEFPEAMQFSECPNCKLMTKLAI